MTNATQKLVDALKSHDRVVKQTGKEQYIAQCPAHPDGNPSLSIRKGRGQALLFCFAGCTAQEITDVLGLRIEDLFDNPKGVDYEYRKGGQIVRTVHRTPQKKFLQNIVDKTVVLYSPDGREDFTGLNVWLPEGEKDADVLQDCGVVAVSAPMGAQAWAKCDYAPLKAAKSVMIVADRDEPGIARAQGLHQLFQSWGVDAYICQPKIGKDATDHVVAGFGIADFVDVDADELVDEGFEAEVDEVTHRLMVQEEAKKRVRDLRLAQVSTTLQPKPLEDLLSLNVSHDWLVDELLERKDRFVLTGGEGSGKSYLLRQMAITIGSGLHPFDRFKHIIPRKVLVVDAENTEHQWARAAKYITEVCLQTGKADPRKNVIVSAGTRLDFTRSADVNQVHKLIDTYQPDILLIGPLYKLVPKEITTDDEAAPLIMALDGLRERGVTLLMEAHAGHAKGLGGERDLRPRGSSALLGWPEFGYGLQPVLGNEDMFKFQKWRGDRDKREWPSYLRKGFVGELTWERTQNI